MGWTKIGDSMVHICATHRPKRCFYCGKTSEFLCDFPVQKKKNGKWKTCDKAMCLDCTQKGVSGKTDFCREHFNEAKAAYLRRINKK